MRDFLAVSKSISDANRLRILMMLQGRELCVCQITEVLGLAPSTVSKHLSLLTQAGLVETRREGRWIHCRIPDRGAGAGIVSQSLDLVRDSLSSDAQIRADAKRLRQILRVPPEELCQRQSCRR